MSSAADRDGVSEIVAGLKTFAARVIVNGLLAAEAMALAPTDVVCMCLLQLHGPATAGWLAQMTGLSTGAITGVVDRLERSGYATRSQDPEDRRRVIVVPDVQRFTRDLDLRAPTRSPASLAFLGSYSASQLRAARRFVSDLAASAPLA